MHPLRAANVLIIVGLTLLFLAEGLRLSLPVAPAPPGQLTLLADQARVSVKELATPDTATGPALRKRTQEILARATAAGEPALLDLARRAATARTPNEALPHLARIAAEASSLDAERSVVAAAKAASNRNVTFAFVSGAGIVLVLAGIWMYLGPLQEKLADYYGTRKLLPASEEQLCDQVARVIQEAAHAALISEEALSVERMLRMRARSAEDTAKALEEQINVDAKTKLLSKTAFESVALRALDRFLDAGPSAGPGIRFSIAEIDLDLFKRVNDKYGHDQGDRALVLAANCIRQAIRPGDYAARPQGDEFYALLFEHPGDAQGDGSDPGFLFAERLFSVLDDAVLEIEIPGGRTVPHQPRMSVGFVAVAESEMTVLEHDQSEGARAVAVLQLLKQADKALYDAKRSGRGCVRKYRPGGADDHPVESPFEQAVDELKRHAHEIASRPPGARAQIMQYIQAALGLLHSRTDQTAESRATDRPA